LCGGVRAKMGSLLGPVAGRAPGRCALGARHAGTVRGAIGVDAQALPVAAGALGGVLGVGNDVGMLRGTRIAVGSPAGGLRWWRTRLGVAVRCGGSREGSHWDRWSA